MTRIKLIVTGAKVRAEVDGVLTSGAVGIPVEIRCDGAWGGLTRNLVCASGKWGPSGPVKAILNVGNSATVAHEVMIAENHLYIGVEGRNTDGTLVIPTMWADCGLIRPGVDVNATPSVQPTLPVWAQLQQQILDLNVNGIVGAKGEDGGYYIPAVSQPDDETVRFDFTPSKSGMPAVASVTLELPVSENGNGLTAAQIEALDGMFQVCAFTKEDVSAEYSAFKTAFGVSGSEEEHTHSYTSSVTKAATCTTAGVRTYTCACGESYTEAIAATGHNYVDGVCTVCGGADPSYEEDVTLSSISATYSGGDVAVGTAVTDLTGIVVTAHYSDGTTTNVSGYTLSGAIAEGENTITVTYGGKSATFTVTGVAESSDDGGSGTVVTNYSIVTNGFARAEGYINSNGAYATAYFEVLEGETYTATASSGKQAPQFVLTNSGYAGESTYTVIDYLNEHTDAIATYTTTYTVPQDGCLLVPYGVASGVTIIKE